MSIFDAVTSLLPGGSSASGPSCGACAAKDADIQRLNAEVARQARLIRALNATISLVREQVVPEVAKATALKTVGKPGYDLKQFVLARKILKIIGK